jgi:hypothetical protein
MKLSKRNMNRVLPLLASTLLAATALVPSVTGQPVPLDKPERWLHIRVDNQTAKGEMVRVNVPLEPAEKVLPTIHNDKLHDGKVRVHQAEVNGVDLRALLEAVRTTRDGEFVTVQGTHGDVRVVKQAGYLLVHVREDKDSAKKHVEIRVPMNVIDALLSAGSNELDLVAAIRALSAQGDTELVRIKDENNLVRVWIDSKNTSE